MEQQASRMLEESVSLFGIIGELDKTKTLFTLLILIVTLSVFDTCLDMVEYFAEDAGYSGLLQKMYKEIMRKWQASSNILCSIKSFSFTLAMYSCSYGLHFLFCVYDLQ